MHISLYDLELPTWLKAGFLAELNLPELQADD